MCEGDPAFNKILSTFIEPTPKNREILFYAVCVPTRFTLYTLAFMYRKTLLVKLLVLIASVISAFNLFRSLPQPQTQWWSKKFQFYISILLIISTGISIFSNYLEIVTPVLLYISLLGGILQRLRLGSC